MKTRLIVFFLTATQCIFFVGCASRNAPQRREQQNPFPSEQQPFSNPTRTDTERNNDNDRDSRNIDNDRNDRDRNNDNDRDSRDRDNDRNDRNDGNHRDRNNNGGGEYRNRQKKYNAPGWHSHRINVTTSEMTFRLSQSDIPAGDVDFIVTNAGRIPHEMSVIKTTFPANQLPVTQNGLLDQQKAGEKVGEINAQELKGGATRVLRVNLTPGKYLVVSNPPGNFQGAMKAIFVVK
ncbi:hypothetical protein [Calothrix sp. PCC 6303]|uniref:hypothetical protein n=1 Tax=Calothrix sp. PCC 6303 TaxID=1170562 RepID=UPI0002A04A19|nr:hypothetical protein [Calothrix sp. PCC 6303]AFZ03101.1 hypothetical protein Cal6303_4190 [Calothrix sp. PCC 6303]